MAPKAIKTSKPDALNRLAKSTTRQATTIGGIRRANAGIQGPNNVAGYVADEEANLDDHVNGADDDVPQRSQDEDEEQEDKLPQEMPHAAHVGNQTHVMLKPANHKVGQKKLSKIQREVETCLQGVRSKEQSLNEDVPSKDMVTLLGFAFITSRTGNYENTAKPITCMPDDMVEFFKEGANKEILSLFVSTLKSFHQLRKIRARQSSKALTDRGAVTDHPSDFLPRPIKASERFKIHPEKKSWVRKSIVQLYNHENASSLKVDQVYDVVLKDATRKPSWWLEAATKQGASELPFLASNVEKLVTPLFDILVDKIYAIELAEYEKKLAATANPLPCLEDPPTLIQPQATPPDYPHPDELPSLFSSHLQEIGSRGGDKIPRGAVEKTRLVKHQWKGCRVWMKGDGNCFFYALSYYLFGTRRYHKILRARYIKWMEDALVRDPTLYIDGAVLGFSTINKYLDMMKMDGGWTEGGVESTGQIADMLKIVIEVYDLKDKKIYTFPIAEAERAERRVVKLIYNGTDHYEGYEEIPKPPKGPRGVKRSAPMATREEGVTVSGRGRQIIKKKRKD